MRQQEPEAGDAALISRVRAGDTDAYGTLCERHVHAARGLARHLADGDVAEDAVQEALAKILDLMRRGGGPDSGFRPYLLTAVRRAVYDRYRADRRVQPTDRIDDFDRGTPFEDPAIRDLERSMVLGAFHSLPERWQTVLWHTEIEGARPAEVAPLLGLTPGGVAALAYRAREGLRQAYLQMHLAALPADRGPCRAAVDKLGAYVRDGLARRDTRRVRGHLDGCADCKAVYLELAELNGALREILGPLVLGAAATAYLASGGGLLGGLFGWLGRLPKRGQQALGGAAAVACTVALAMALVSNDDPLPEPKPAPPVVARPVVPAAPP
ncbi:sigma-70 family RNA polymerase sigma factor, partial [Actinomadura sp. CNU-125]|uniref:sigma-70 family RNA polymerase sigma factor n=1 Tax=Actinomadura sp. CNU-125 TaxID=1904961 RepID=UPI00117775B6